jgi:DNA-directed RNA polymerase specialized sigma24 family protein
MPSNLSSAFGQAAGGDAESFVVLVTALQREVRVFIAAYASSRAMVDDAQRATWAAVRRSLPGFHGGLDPVAWVLTLAGRELGPRLEAGDRVAVSEQDTLRHILARNGIEAFQARDAQHASPLAQLEARFARLDPAGRELLQRRYGERRSLTALTALQGVSAPDIADQLSKLRAAVDWISVPEAPAGDGDRLLPALIEDYLADAIDPDSRGLLAASLMKDMRRCLRFERQARVDLVLGAMLAPAGADQARALSQLVWWAPDDSSRLLVEAPIPRRPSESDPRVRAATDARRHPTANRRPASQAPRPGAGQDEAEPPRRDGTVIWMVAAAFILVGVIGLVVMRGGRGAAPVSAPVPLPATSAAPSTAASSTSSGGPGPIAPTPGRTAAPLAVVPRSAPEPRAVAFAPGRVFLRGINLGGGEVAIAGNQWLSQRQALGAGLVLGKDTAAAGGGGVGATDFDTKAMLATGLGSPSGQVQLSQRVPDGDYDLWLWVAAQGTLDPGAFAVRVGGQDQPLGQPVERHDGWWCLGPYHAHAVDHRLELAFAGLRNAYLAGLALTAKAAPAGMLPVAVALVEPAEDTRRYLGQAFTLRADATPADGIVRVDFYDGAARLGESTTPPFTLDWTVAAVGAHALTARAIARDGTESSSSPVTVQAFAGGSGTILREWWSDIDGDRIADLMGNPRFAGPPSGTARESSFLAPRDWADRYGQRMRGWVHPPVSGAYTFWICSDNDGELWLSPDDQPSGKARIALVQGAVGFDHWEDRPDQRSQPVQLEAGRRYYIEALQKEGGGADHLEVGWQWPDGTLERPISGWALSPCQEGTVASAPVAPAAAPVAPAAAPAAPAVPRFVKGIDFGGDAVVIDGNAWLSQRQAEEDNASAPPPTVVQVSDLPFREVANGNGPVEHDRSTGGPALGDGRGLSIAGAAFAKGLGTHSKGEVDVTLDGKYAAFLADVGVDDEAADPASVGFQVWADGVLLADIPLMRFREAAKPIRVALAGRKELKLITTDGGNGSDWDHADWGGARLLRAGPPSGPLVIKSGRKGLAVMSPKPAVDAAGKVMLCSSLTGAHDGALAFTQVLPVGRYQVYVWVMETGVSNARLFDLDLNGEILADLGNLPGGGWAKYGPCTVSVPEGLLTVTAKPRKGTPMLMGMAIFTAP